MSFNQELQEDLINSSILRSAFFNYFYRIFNNVADESFIGVSSKYLSYFNDLKEYVESDEYNNACKLFEEYVSEEENAENFSVKFGYFDNDVVDSKHILAVSKLPTRDELIGMLLSIWNAPVRYFVTGLSNLKKQKEE